MPSPPPVDGRSALLQLRGLVGECIAANLLDSAAFYADKLVDLSGGDPADVLALAQVYSFDGAHMRAYRLLERHGLVKVRAGGALATPEDASPRAGAYRLHALHLATRSLLRGGRPEAAAELLKGLDDLDVVAERAEPDRGAQAAESGANDERGGGVLLRRDGVHASSRSSSLNRSASSWWMECAERSSTWRPIARSAGRA